MWRSRAEGLALARLRIADPVRGAPAPVTTSRRPRSRAGAAPRVRTPARKMVRAHGRTRAASSRQLAGLMSGGEGAARARSESSRLTPIREPDRTGDVGPNDRVCCGLLGRAGDSANPERLAGLARRTRVTPRGNPA